MSASRERVQASVQALSEATSSVSEAMLGALKAQTAQFVTAAAEQAALCAGWQQAEGSALALLQRLPPPRSQIALRNEILSTVVQILLRPSVGFVAADALEARGALLVSEAAEAVLRAELSEGCIRPVRVAALGASPQELHEVLPLLRDRLCLFLFRGL